MSSTLDFYSRGDSSLQNLYFLFCCFLSSSKYLPILVHLRISYESLRYVIQKRPYNVGNNIAKIANILPVYLIFADMIFLISPSSWDLLSINSCFEHCQHHFIFNILVMKNKWMNFSVSLDSFLN